MLINSSITYPNQFIFPISDVLSNIGRRNKFVAFFFNNRHGAPLRRTNSERSEPPSPVQGRPIYRFYMI